MERVDYLKNDETRSLLETAAKFGVRDELMVQIPLYTGCRIGEASALSVADCEPRIGRIKFSKVAFRWAALMEKDGHGEWIYTRENSLSALMEDEKGYTGKKHKDKPEALHAWWLANRKELGLRHEGIKEGLKASQPTRVAPIAEGPLRRKLDDWTRESKSNGFIFESQKGGRLLEEQIKRKVTAIMKAAGIPEEKCYPHMLRHTFAVSFLKKNPNAIFQLARILGHTNIKTTSIYLRFVVEDLQALLNASGDLYAGQ